MDATKTPKFDPPPAPRSNTTTPPPKFNQPIAPRYSIRPRPTLARRALSNPDNQLSTPSHPTLHPPPTTTTTPTPSPPRLPFNRPKSTFPPRPSLLNPTNPHTGTPNPNPSPHSSPSPSPSPSPPPSPTQPPTLLHLLALESSHRAYLAAYLVASTRLQSLEHEARLAWAEDGANEHLAEMYALEGRILEVRREREWWGGLWRRGWEGVEDAWERFLGGWRGDEEGGGSVEDGEGGE